MPALGQRVMQLEGHMQDQADSIGEVRRAVEDLRVETRAEAKELRTDIKDLRADMDRRFDRVDQKVDRQFMWLVGILVGVLLGLVGLAFQVARLQPA